MSYFAYRLYPLLAQNRNLSASRLACCLVVAVDP